MSQEYILLAIAVSAAIVFTLFTVSIMLKKQRDRLNQSFQRFKSQQKDELIKRMNRIEEHTKDIQSDVLLKSNQIQGLKEQLSALNSVADSLPLCYWFKDVNGRMLYTNPMFERLFLKPLGLSSADYYLKKDAEIFGLENAKHFAVGDNYVKDTREIYEQWENVKNDDGTTISVLVVKFPIYENKIFKGVAGIIKEFK